MTVRLSALGLFVATLTSTCAAQAPALAPDTNPANTFTTGNLATYPINTRQFESLTLLLSTANSAALAEGSSGDNEADLADNKPSTPTGGISFSGISSTQNAETLDGLSTQQDFRSRPRGSIAGGPITGAAFGQSTLRSYRVMPSTYAAQFGEAAGAVLAITSRSGSDQWHAAAFAQLRNSAFAATNPFSLVTSYQNGTVANALVKPQDTLIQTGAHVSLPLGRYLHVKHLALFASFEEQLRNDPAISSPASADFYNLTAMQSALLANRGVTTSAINTALDYLSSLTGPVPRSSTRALAFARFDHQLTPHDHLVFTTANNRFSLPAGTGYRSPSNAVINSGIASVGNNLVQVDAVAAHWQHAFAPHLRHTLRFQFVHDLESETPRTPLPQEPAIGLGGFAPEVEIAPQGFTYGTPANLGRQAYPDEHRLQIANEFQLLHGRHLFTAGTDWSRIDDRIATTQNTEGTFLYDSTNLSGHAGGFVDWITDQTFGVNAYPSGGCPSIHAAIHDFCFRSYTQTFAAAQTRFITHHLAGYAEDAFHFRKDLQFTLGGRYEYTLLPLPQSPNQPLDSILRTLDLPITGVTSTFPEDRNNLGPRVSVAWSPPHTGGLALHLGYGIFYGRLAGTTVQSALTNTALPSTTTQIRIRPTTETACPQNPTVGFGFPCDFLSAPPAAVEQTTAVMLFPRNFRLPAVQRASLSLERNLGKRVFLRASYAMSLTTQLPSSTDLNIVPSTTSTTFMLQGGDQHPGLRTGEIFVLPVYTARRLTQYGPITALVSNANATYHSATIEAELRRFHSLELRAAYTFSRAIDYAPQLSATPRNDAQLDPFTNGYDKGLSTLQFPNRFSANAIYRLGLNHAPRSIRSTFNNWRIAAIATVGSGGPYSYEISGGSYLSGGHETINASGGATYLPTVGRNTLHLPTRASVDLRLERTFTLPDTLKLSLFAEAFNLLNRRNLTQVETRAFLPGAPATAASPTPLVFQDAPTIASEGLTTPAFGQPTSSTAGLSRERQLEFGLRLQF